MGKAEPLLQSESGVSYILVLGALVALIGVGAFTIDAGAILVGRTQLQNAVDSAALAGSADLVDDVGAVVTLSEAQARAVEYGALNDAQHSAVTIAPADLEYGSWDLRTRTFDTSVDLTDPRQVTALRVTGRLDGTTNAAIPAQFARILGRSEFAVSTKAIGYLGYSGGIGPGKLPFPVAIDCCELRGSPNCDQDYCQTVTTNPPNPCALTSPQTGAPSVVSCLEFASTPEQNACWTALSETDSAVSTTAMRKIITDWNPNSLDTRSQIFLDNGTKTAVMNTLSDRFYGSGAWNASTRGGTDRYAPFDGVSDSWVVPLPVVECQDDINCAGGENARVQGYVCFEVREIIGAPNKLIKGRFLCASDPLFEDCDLDATSGGEDYGIRAHVPVLVD
jgi:hypothetical protein